MSTLRCYRREECEGGKREEAGVDGYTTHDPTQSGPGLRRRDPIANVFHSDGSSEISSLVTVLDHRRKNILPSQKQILPHILIKGLAGDFDRSEVIHTD